MVRNDLDLAKGAASLGRNARTDRRDGHVGIRDGFIGCDSMMRDVLRGWATNEGAEGSGSDIRSIRSAKSPSQIPPAFAGQTLELEWTGK